ncbi:MAG TPA: hypothetical protein VLA19_25815, partial [Herpetosiphonaceae bacterium]|nr:hypothetical protein [Herpetosiphonaceae bacterium]
MKVSIVPPIPSSAITPGHVYRSRRQFMRGIGALALGSVALAACGDEVTDQGAAGAAATVGTPVPGA